MSAATFKLELKSPPRKDGLFAVRIRITRFRRHAYWNLGRYIEKNELNPKPKERLKNWVLKNRNAPQINDAIAAALDGLADVADKNPGLTAAGIKEAYQKQLNPDPEVKPLSFYDYAEEYIQRLKDRTFHTGRCFEYEFKEFKAIAGEHAPYNELFSPRIIHKYLQALKSKGNSPGTIQAKVRRLRKLYQSGIKEQGYPQTGQPFDALKISVAKKKKARPTAEQIRQFISYQPEGELQTMAKNVALLQYLLQGARVAEALTLQWSNVQENYIEYLPQKGAGKPKFIPRSKMLNNLLDGLPKEGLYVLPYIGEDYATLPDKKKYYRKSRVINQVNKGLEEIGKELKFGLRLSSHMMRHAFADAVIATGSSVHVAAKLLGHANPQTTENYIRDLQLEDISEVSAAIFDSLEGEQTGEQ